MGKGLQIISEPEAAAIYALHAMDPHSIKIGDTFVLCDAGGGTVDLISYTVSALKPILQVEEAAMGTGRICGSTFLNRIFQRYLTEKLSLNEEWDDEVVEDAMKRFELVTKKVFRGDLDEEYVIPGECDLSILYLSKDLFSWQLDFCPFPYADTSYFRPHQPRQPLEESSPWARKEPKTTPHLP